MVLPRRLLLPVPRPWCCQLALPLPLMSGSKRRAGDADLGVGLPHPGDGRGDVEIMRSGLFDQGVQFRASGSRATSRMAGQAVAADFGVAR